MDHGHFDKLTRSLAIEDETRRGAFRLLAGGAFGILAARLGLGIAAEAKNKKQKRKRRPERKPQGELQAEGNRKGKRPGKKKPKPSQPPCDSGRKRCTDGSCVSQALCCPGERMCAGGACQPQSQCCPDEWQCADGSCVDNNQCCPGEKQCGGGVCVSANQCCPGEKACGGSCVAQDECCPGEKRCDDGSCIAENECCADAPYPLCTSGCQRAVCVNGNLRCVDRELGALCKMKGGNDGTCCNGQCTREALTCPADPWRVFNADTCQCECPSGSTPSSIFAGHCCPAGYPYSSGYDGRCYAEGGGGGVCHLGYSPCVNEQYPQYTCCRNGT